MRIIAGKFKGKKIYPPIKDVTRPTSDRIRETIMGILEGGRYGSPLNSKTIIDLFAGTGSFGIEALSRGNADKVIFIENNSYALSALKANIKKFDLENKTQIIQKSLSKLETWDSSPSSLIFSDPPYHSNLSNEFLTTLANLNAIKNNCLAIVETSYKEPDPEIKDFTIIESRKIGKTNIHFLKYK